MFERELGKDRRKNISRQKADVTYEVVWSDERRTYEVYRNGQKTRAFANDQDRAVEFATDLAQRDKGLGLDALVFAERDGTKSLAWAGVKPQSE